MINFDAVLTPKKFHKTIMAHNSKCSSNLFQGGGGDKDDYVLFNTREGVFYHI